MDLIERQAAIDAINTWDKFGVDERGRVVRWYEGLEPYVHLRDVVMAIGNLTSAQQESDWIPVTKKAHPDKEGKYLVTDDAGGMADSNWDEFIFCDDGTPSWMYSQNVTAWKPFPEPWEEERREDGKTT